MFIAKKYGTNELVKASDAKVSERYYCPGCTEIVQLKRGKTKLTHFAHVHLKNCQVSAEGETVTHLQGKLALFQYFHERYDEVKLEPWLQEIKQRPDLMVRKGHKWTVIEFQCAPITIKRVRQRTNGYRQLHLQVVWVLGQTYQEKRLQSSTMAKFAFIYQNKLQIAFWNQKDSLYRKSWWQLDGKGYLSQISVGDNRMQQLLKIQQLVLQARSSIRPLQNQLYQMNRCVVGIPWICHPVQPLPGGLKIPQWYVLVQFIILLETGPQSLNTLLGLLHTKDWQQFGCLRLSTLQHLWLQRVINDWSDAKIIWQSGDFVTLVRPVKWFKNYQDKLLALSKISPNHINSRNKIMNKR